jgi:hypothetical protein
MQAPPASSTSRRLTAAHVRRETVHRAVQIGHLGSGRTSCRRVRKPARAGSHEVVLTQPVPDCRVRDAQSFSHGTDGQAFLDERLELLELDTAARRMAGRVLGRQAVLVDPVRDGRGGTARLVGDGLDRAAGGELGFERGAVHDNTNTSSYGGRNRTSGQAMTDHVAYPFALGRELAHAAAPA